MALAVQCTTECVVSRKELSEHTFKTAAFRTAFSSLQFDVPISLNTFTINNTKGKVEFAHLTAARLSFSESVVSQQQIPFSLVKTFFPKDEFLVDTGRKCNSLFTTNNRVDVDCLAQFEVQEGVLRVGNAETPDHCTVLHSCMFEEEDCNVFASDLSRMTAFFQNEKHAFSCPETLHFNKVEYKALTLSEQHVPLRVNTLRVDNTLVGMFEVVQDVVVVLKKSDVGNTLNITMSDGARVAVVDGDNNPIEATQHAQYLFRGEMHGLSQTISEATCKSGRRFSALTTENTSSVFVGSHNPN